MDDTVQLIFFALLILFGLLSGGRKRRRRTGAPRAQAPRGPTAPSPEGRAPDAGPQRLERAGGDRFDEFLEMLKGTVPEERERRAPASPEEDDDIRPLETLEAAGEESHRLFHERYDEPSAPAIARPLDTPRAVVSRFRVTGRSLKDAIVLAEILGPPKALGESGGKTGSHWSAPIG